MTIMSAITAWSCTQRSMAGWAYWEMGNPEEQNQAAPDESCHSETDGMGKALRSPDPELVVCSRAILLVCFTIGHIVWTAWAEQHWSVFYFTVDRR